MNRVIQISPVLMAALATSTALGLVRPTAAQAEVEAPSAQVPQSLSSESLSSERLSPERLSPERLSPERLGLETAGMGSPLSVEQVGLQVEPSGLASLPESVLASVPEMERIETALVSPAGAVSLADTPAPSQPALDQSAPIPVFVPTVSAPAIAPGSIAPGSIAPDSAPASQSAPVSSTPAVLAPAAKAVAATPAPVPPAAVSQSAPIPVFVPKAEGLPVSQPQASQSPASPPQAQTIAQTPAPRPTSPTPETTPRPAPAPSPTPGAPRPSTDDPRVLVSEILVKGVEGNPAESEMLDAVYGAIRTRPGLPTTSSQLQADLNAIFATGFFADVDFTPEDTPLGVRITFVVQPNPVLREVKTEGATVIPPDVIKKNFEAQYGKILNFNELQTGVKLVNRWYQEQGYVLAQVVDATKVSPDGVVTLTIAEGVVDSIQVKFINAEGNETNPDGTPVRGRTKDYIITREFSLQPGTVFNRAQAERDLQRLAGLGIFQDVRLALDPASGDPRKVVVVAQVIEGRTGSIGASGGFSSSSGIFGSLSLGQENFRGRNQKLRTEVTLGQRDFLFDLSYTDPWLKNDPFRTSMSLNIFRRRSTSLIFSGGDRDINLPNGDTPRILRIGGGVQFARPLSRNVFEPSEWSASLGMQYQRIAIRDRRGRNRPQDELGNDLTFSGDDADDLILLQGGLARDRRNDRLQPTQGSISRLSMDQSIPIGSGSILMNRLRANHSQYFPLRLLRFTEGCRKPNPTPAECPQALAFNIQGGTILGDLPPYEAFALGGANSVRGWGEGEVGSGRSFLQLSAEYRFPLFSFIGGALFADYGTDLGSGRNVPGEPAEIREKPGNAYGIGLGVRVRSPLGPIRADYAILTEGDTRFQFGIGERF